MYSLFQHEHTENLDDVENVLTAQKVAVEIVTNLCCTEGRLPVCFVQMKQTMYMQCKRLVLYRRLGTSLYFTKC